MDADALNQHRADPDLLRNVVGEDSAVRAYVRSVTGGHRETEDVIQEVWRVVCRKIGEYDPQRPFRAWVLGIARLQLLKWRQSLARSREVLTPEVIELLAETADECREELDLRSQFLRDCLAKLPASSRQLLQLKYYGGLTAMAVATELGRTPASVEMALVRLRRTLRACIEKRLTAVEEPVS